MAIMQPNQKIQTTQSQGSSGGGGLGQLIGAGVGALAAGLSTGGMGAAQGATAGASLGGMVGGAIAPGQQGSVQQSQVQNVPTLQVSQDAMRLADGLRALNEIPELANKYAQPLTQAYINTQMELKRRG